MTLAAAELRELATVAIAAGTEAGAMIRATRPETIERKDVADSAAAQVVTEVDHRSEEIILGYLAPTIERFGLALLTEERPDDGSRLTADHFWCIDPLDGTLPFIEGVPGYAISIALVARDGTPLIGVVHDPVTSTTTHAIRGDGAWRDGERWTGRSDAGDQFSVFVDRSFEQDPERSEILASLERVADDLGLDGLRLHAGAGAVMNACGVLDSAPACYPKPPKASGGGSLWDFAATACIFGEVDAFAGDIRGVSLDLNRADSTFMHHRGVLYATDIELARRISAALGFDST